MNTETTRATVVLVLIMLLILAPTESVHAVSPKYSTAIDRIDNSTAKSTRAAVINPNTPKVEVPIGVSPAVTASKTRHDFRDQFQNASVEQFYSYGSRPNIPTKARMYIESPRQFQEMENSFNSLRSTNSHPFESGLVTQGVAEGGAKLIAAGDTQLIAQTEISPTPVPLPKSGQSAIEELAELCKSDTVTRKLSASMQIVPPVSSLLIRERPVQKMRGRGRTHASGCVYL